MDILGNKEADKEAKKAADGTSSPIFSEKHSNEANQQCYKKKVQKDW